MGPGRLVCVLVAAAVTTAVVATRPAHAPAPAATPAALSTAVSGTGHLDALARIASEHGGTRAAGTGGDTASQAYVAGLLGTLGYRVRLQRVPILAFRERRPPSVRVAGRRLASNAVRTLEFSGSGDARGTARAVARRGCARGDYAALRAGEVALVRRGGCPFAAKARAAQAAGAGALLVVNDGPGTVAGTLGRPGVRIPALVIAPAAAPGLAGRMVRVEVAATIRRGVTRNVIAERGSARRVVMAGAHLDSVGAGPGINDDGSGVAALLDAASALAADPPRGATVRLAFWGAEELGLIGSRRYVASLSAAERRRIAAYVNLDMVASPNPVREVYGHGAVARDLLAALPGARRTSIGGRSDHATFAAAGIPVGGLFAGAEARKTAAEAAHFGGRAGKPLDPCYHRACDGADNVDPATLRAMTRAATTVMRELARRPSPRSAGGPRAGR